MRIPTTFRSLLNWTLLLGLFAGYAHAGAQPPHGQQRHMFRRTQTPAPIVRKPPSPPPSEATRPSVEAPRPPSEAPRPAPVERRDVPPGGNTKLAPDRGHLAQWMNQHGNLTPAEQQQALQHEPGFHELPAQTQQRYMELLSQLNAMPPEQRQRLLVRNEWMEHLTPDQRAQVRGATEQFGALPPNQRPLVQRKFRELRALPPDQRMAALNSEQLRSQMNPAQVNALRGLMHVEPMMPPY